MAQIPPTLKRRPELWLLLLVPLWLAVLVDLRDAIQPSVPWLDEKVALRRAASMAEGEFFDQGGGWLQPPGYPALLALTRAEAPPLNGVFAEQPLVRGWQLAQIAAWLGIAACLLASGRRLLGARWGWLPPLFFALFAEGWILALRPLPEIWLALASAFVLLESTRGPDSFRVGQLFLVGLAAGAAALLRGHAFLLAAPLLFLLASRKLWKPSLTLCLGILLPIVMTSALHSREQGRLSGISSNAGINFYVGNRAEASGLYDVDSSYDFARDAAGRQWLRSLGGSGDGPLAQVDAEWREIAFAEVLERPASSALLFLRKCWLQLVGMEIPQIDGVRSWLLFAPSMRLFFLPFGLLSALAFSSIFWSRKERALGLVVMGLVLLIVAQSLFFVTGRFRLIFLPQLCLLAGFATAQMTELLRVRSSWRGTLRAVSPLVVGALFVLPWGLGGIRASLQGGVDTNLGARWSQLIAARYTAGDEATAFAQLERWRRDGGGAELDERSGLLHVKLLSERARHDDAQARADELQESFPESPRVRHARALSYVRAGKLMEADQILRVARGRFPDDEQIHRLWQNVQKDIGG